MEEQSQETTFETRVSADTISSLIEAGENELVEFKQEWPELKTREGKAKLIKMLLAMGNSATTETSGIIIFGAKDEKHGGGIATPANRPAREAVHQMVDEFIAPHLSFKIRDVEVEGVTLDVITIDASLHWPHALTRPLDDLPTDGVWIRRGQTTTHLSVAEIRRRLSGLNPQKLASTESHPLEIGFLNQLDMARGVVRAMVRNAVDEPINDVTVTFELSGLMLPGSYRRERQFAGPVGAQETKEFKIEVRDSILNRHDNLPVVKLDDSNSTHFWLDITMYVSYRNNAGFLREMQEVLHTAG